MEKSTNEILRERLEADMERFFGDGGAVDEIPTGVSGEKRMQLKQVGARQLYREGSKGEGWRDYEKNRMERNAKKGKK